MPKRQLKRSLNGFHKTDSLIRRFYEMSLSFQLIPQKSFFWGHDLKFMSHPANPHGCWGSETFEGRAGHYKAVVCPARKPLILLALEVFWGHGTSFFKVDAYICQKNNLKGINFSISYFGLTWQAKKIRLNR